MHVALYIAIAIDHHLSIIDRPVLGRQRLESGNDSGFQRIFGIMRNNYLVLDADVVESEMLDNSRSHRQKKDSNNQIGGLDYVNLGQQ